MLTLINITVWKEIDMLKDCQKGATMIEMIGVMGVISMITVGIFATVSKIYDRYHQTAIVTQIRDLQKNIQTRYATASDYRDLAKSGIMKTLIAERVIPFSMVSGDEVYHAYRGEVKLSGTQYNYTITFSDIKKAGCVDLVTMDWTVNNTSDLIELKVGGKTFTWTGTNSSNSLPVSVAMANTVCKDKREDNEIKWTFQ